MGSLSAYGRCEPHEVNFASDFAMCPAATTTAMGSASRRQFCASDFAPPNQRINMPSASQSAAGKTKSLQMPVTQP